MKLLHFDCFAGAAGDMVVASLVGLGVPLDKLRATLALLPVSGFRLDCRTERRKSFAGLRFVVDAEEDGQPHRTFADIRAMIDDSGLSPFVRRHAVGAFRRIADAEARVHGVAADKVHFHEVGAIDSIVDIVAACAAVESLAPDRVTASRVTVGRGTVDCAHGRFPVPAGATLEILRGVPLRQADEEGERVTPTGAALLVELCDAFGPMPPCRVESIGYGLGGRDLPITPNVLRAVLGASADDGETDTVTVLETNLDDATPEMLADACDRLRAAGALDVYTVPAGMKKGRSGVLLGVLCDPAAAGGMAERVLRLTTAFGVRMHEARRVKLERSVLRVDGPYGPVEIKVGRLAGEPVTWAPEYESVRQAADRSGTEPRRVYQWALAQAAQARDEDSQ